MYDVEQIKRLGLIASDPTQTSLALRAVACGGKIKELIRSDDRSFEHVIVAHLELFYEHVVKASSVQRYTFKEAPYQCTRTKTKIDDKERQLKNTRYHCQTGIDIAYIFCKKVVNETTPSSATFALIATISSEPQAQIAGGDVIVFYSHLDETNTTLNVDVHLYHAKHNASCPFAHTDFDDKKNSKLVHLLGVCTEESDPSINSSFYSRLGMNKLISLLKTGFKLKLLRM